MNDVENKLRQLQFQRPPESLRSELLDAMRPSTRSGLRDWLWPSPFAWATLAAAWVIMAFVQVHERQSASGSLSLEAKQQFIRYAAIMEQNQSLILQP